jgi:LuxR family maltose regulon positive regulatory protein
MDERISIIKTKLLVPRRRPDLLHRSRLVDFIHEHIDRKLILISAAAGYGKTSLLTDYAHDTDLPVCWYSLDEWDRDPRVFLEYLVASIRDRFPHFGERTLGALQAGMRVEGTRSIVGTMVNEIYEVIPEYFVLVIDDFHLISDGEEVGSLFSPLLRHLPENCHIILASRTTTPELPIVELMARQELAGLGNEDLRFTTVEIQELLKQNHNLDLPAEEAGRLAQQSEGWITAILLTTHTLWKGLLRTMARTQGDDSQIFAYLAREVLEQQTEEVQDFLKGSSVLQRMNPALCNNLLGIDNSREMLTLLEDKNLFIARLEGDGGDWFRYHQLFQEFLSAKLREEGDSYVSLHLQAGEILERQQSWDEAIRHYLHADAYERAARLVEAIASPTFRSGRWGSLLFWIQSLVGKASLSPWILYWQSKVFTDSGRLDDAVRALRKAREGFSETGDLRGEVNVLLEESDIHRLRGEYDQAIAKAEEVLSTADLEHGGDKITLASAHRIMGICYGLQGRLKEGLAQLEEALGMFESLGSEREYDVANTLHDIGRIYLPVDADRFLHYSRKALVHWRRLGAKGPLAITLNNIGVAQYRQGRFDEALMTLQESLAESQLMGLMPHQAYAQATTGDIYRARGEYGLAQDAYDQALVLAEEASEGFLVGYIMDALGNIQRVLGKYDEAERLIGEAIERGYEHGSDYEVAVGQISRGILLHVRGRDDEAAESMRRALDTLQNMGAKQELAKAHFHLSSILFSRGHVSEAMLSLEMALDIVAQVGFDPLLLDEGTGSRSLVQYALGEASLQEHKVLLHKILRRTEPDEEAVRLPAPEPTPAKLEFCALGPSKVRKDAQPVDAQELRLGAREMLFFFLAHLSVTKEQVVAALWPHLSLSKAHSTFHFYLFQVRRLLGGSASISYEGGVYRLESRQYEYDVEQFQRALAKAEKARGGQCEVYLRQAVSLYQGDYLEDIYSDWAEELRSSLQREYFRAVEELAGYHGREGRIDEAVGYYRKLLDKDPFREDIHCQVMRLLAQAGDRAGAIRHFEELRRILGEEMDVEPSAETTRLYKDLVAGDA